VRIETLERAVHGERLLKLHPPPTGG